jgi:hypothetical protein
MVKMEGTIKKCFPSSSVSAPLKARKKQATSTRIIFSSASSLFQ